MHASIPIIHHRAAAGDPEGFSRVDLCLPDAELRRRFPKFPVRVLFFWFCQWGPSGAARRRLMLT